MYAHSVRSTSSLVAALVVSMTILLGSALPARSQQTADEKACRATIAKSFGKIIKSAQKIVLACHKLRDKGVLSASDDCNDLDLAETLTGKSVAALLTKADSAITSACEPGGVPVATVLAEFGRCPAPFQALDDAAPSAGIDTFAELGDCINTHARAITGNTAARVMGLPSVVPLTKELSSCHGAIGKSYTKLVNTMIKERTKCQTSADAAGGPIGFDCVLADPNSKIVGMRDKGSAAIAAKCAAADTLNQLSRAGRAARGVPELDSCAVDLADLQVCALDVAADGAGTGMAAMLWELPGICPTGGSYTVVPVATDTEVDVGFTGFGHDMDPILGYRGVRFTIGCDADCSNCITTAVTSSPEACRCSGDASVGCAVDGDCAVAGGSCQCFYGPPTPYTAAGSTACVQSIIDGTMSGDLDPVSGDLTLNLPLRHRIFLGIGIDQPCPRCVAGACTGGERSGLGCSIDATDATFGDVSYDCPPTLAANISGAGLATDVAFTTGSVSLPMTDPCDSPLGAFDCVCGVCSLDAALTCRDDSDCAAALAGVCDKGPSGSSRKPNSCNDLICSPDVGTEEGTCLAGPTDEFCDGFTSSKGAGIMSCLSNVDCDANDPVCPGGDCGGCTISRDRDCFLDPIDAQGVPGESMVGVGCIGASNSFGVNGALGWPGAYRVRQNLAAELLCSDGVTEYAPPGGSNCP